MFPSKTHLRKFSGDVILNQYISLFNEFVQNLKASWVFEVDGNGALVPVRRKEIRRFRGEGVSTFRQ